MAKKDIVKCSECGVEHDQEIKSYTCRKFTDSDSLRFERRIFDKNGKKFCVSCLVSKYNIDCEVCRKPINSKDEISYFSEVRCAGYNESGEWYENFIPADTCPFRCVACDPYDEDKKESEEDYKKRIIENGGIRHNYKTCQIAGCSQEKPSYAKYCRQHWDKSCQGTHEGKRCDLAIGNDGGDFCERCKNQTETFRQREITFTTENKDNQERNDSNENENKSEILSLPSDNEIKNLTKEQIINLKKQIDTELENRKNKNSQTSNHAITSQELTSKLKELEKALNNLQVCNNFVSPNKDNEVSVGSVIVLISAFCLFVVGILILVKRKFVKNKLIVKKKS